MSIFETGSQSFDALLAKARATEGARIIDVRSEVEYKDGHVPGAVNVPLNQIPTLDAPKDAPLFLYCLSGARSGRACAALEDKLGFTNVNNIGGIQDYTGPQEH